jgi:GNAT superfamily N-acetyltransferase
VSGEYAGSLFGVLELMAEQHPTESHWYLIFLGTRPGWQGRGLGSAVMRPVLETCDDWGLPAYLEATSEHNKRLYQRHGFEVVGEIRLPDGPSLWPMWREPR